MSPGFAPRKHSENIEVAGSRDGHNGFRGLWSEVRLAAAIGVLDTLLELRICYAHERAWNRLNLGGVKTRVVEI